MPIVTPIAKPSLKIEEASDYTHEPDGNNTVILWHGTQEYFQSKSITSFIALKSDPFTDDPISNTFYIGQNFIPNTVNDYAIKIAAKSGQVSPLFIVEDSVGNDNFYIDANFCPIYYVRSGTQNTGFKVRANNYHNFRSFEVYGEGGSFGMAFMMYHNNSNQFAQTQLVSNRGMRISAPARGAVASYGGEDYFDAQLVIETHDVSDGNLTPTAGNTQNILKPKNLFYQNHVATTNDTLTTLFTYDFKNSGVIVNLQIMVVARRTDGTTNNTHRVYKEFVIGKNSSGVTTVKAENHLVPEYKDDAATEVQFNLSGANLLVQVKGKAGESWTWHLHSNFIPVRRNS